MDKVELAVNRFLLGILLGLAVGVVDVLLMLPMKFPGKATALTRAFFSRFAIRFLPDAVITKAYGPIIVTGLIFGALARWAGRAWAA